MSTDTTTKMMPPDFFKWLDKLMEERGFANDNQLADQATVAHSVLSKARNGERRIGHKAGRKLAEALGVSVSIFFQMAGLMPRDHKLDPEREQMADEFSELLPEDRYVVRQLVHSLKEARKRVKE